jgi:cytochrome P450
MRAIKRQIVLLFWRHPRIVRSAAWLIRNTVGIVSASKVMVVVNHADVSKVLGRDCDFTSEGYRDSVLIPNFMISLNRGAPYFEERSLLQDAISPANMGILRDIALDAATSRCAALPERFDVVSEFAVHVPLDIIEKFGGVPILRREDVVKWLRRVGAYIPGEPYASEREHDEAFRYAQHLNQYLDDFTQFCETDHRVIPRERSAVDRIVLSHLANRALLQKSLGGLMIFAHPVVVQGFTLALFALMERPLQMRRACQAAADGDFELVQAYTREAMRFRSVFPALKRSCPRDTLFMHKQRGVQVRAGSSVVALLTGANFDPGAFPNPGNFDVTRPANRYLILGYGMHECIGKRMIDEEIPAMLSALLRPGPLRLQSSCSGPHYDGFVADELLVERCP